jgi:hypothetical protein
MKQARPCMLANLKIICQFHAHPLHQNSVDILWAEIYRVRLLLGPNIVHEYQKLTINKSSTNDIFVFLKGIQYEHYI